MGAAEWGLCAPSLAGCRPSILQRNCVNSQRRRAKPRLARGIVRALRPFREAGLSTFKTAGVSAVHTTAEASDAYPCIPIFCCSRRRGRGGMCCAGGACRGFGAAWSVGAVGRYDWEPAEGSGTSAGCGGRRLRNDRDRTHGLRGLLGKQWLWSMQHSCQSRNSGGGGCGLRTHGCAALRWERRVLGSREFGIEYGLSKLPPEHRAGRTTDDCPGASG